MIILGDLTMQIKVSAEQSQKAVAILANKVYNPVFFSKLAEYGVTPSTQEEAGELLKLAYSLREAAIKSFGQKVVEVGAEPSYVDAAQQFIQSDPQVKAAALVFHNITNQGGV